MTTDDHKAIARRLLEELWSTDDVGLADELFTANFLHHNAAEGTPRHPEGQKQFIPAIPAMAPGLWITVDDLIAEGDRVAARWTGTYTGTDDAPVSYPGVDIMRFEGGRIAELWPFVP